MSVQGCQGSGGWVCEKPGVSGQEGGGYVRDQGCQGSVGWVYERPGILGQRWFGT